MGILCGPNAELIDSSTVIEGRILHARLKVYGLKINAWCVYAPTNVKSESTKAKFFCELRKSVRAMRKKFPSWKIMISGDLNSTLGPDAPKSKFVGNNNVGEYPTTDMGFRLCDFLSDEKLYALNTLFQTKPSHRITWKLGRTAKWLDYFDYFLRQCTRHCRAHLAQSQQFETNHRLVVLYLQVPSKSQRTRMFERREPKPKPAFQHLRDDDAVRQQYSEALNAKMPSFESSDELPAELLNERITKGVHAATVTSIPTVAQKVEPWITDSFRLLVKQVVAEKDKKVRGKLANKLRKMRVRLKSEFHAKRAAKINFAAENRQIEEEYRLLGEEKMLKKSTKALCTSRTTSLPEPCHPPPNSTNSTKINT